MLVHKLVNQIIKGEDHYSVKKQFQCITSVSLPGHHEWNDDIATRMLSCMWCCQQHLHVPGPGGRNFTRHMHNKRCLDGKKVLVFVEGIHNETWWVWLLEFLHGLGCTDGSAIVLVAPYISLGFQIYKRLDNIHPNPHITDYLEKACDLLQDQSGEMKHLLTSILARLCPRNSLDGSGLKMFLHFLYAKRTCNREELVKLHNELTLQLSHANVKRLIVLCFDELPNHYKGCLMYLTAFQHSSPEHPTRRERVTRQWVFHGLLSDKDGTSAALQQADGCFNDLLNRGFISSMETTNEGKVKTFETPKPIMDFLLSLRSTSTGDSSYDKWGHHDEIRKFIKNQRDPAGDRHCGCFQAGAPCRISFLDRDPFGTNELVRDLLASPRIGGVEVLDLQGCRGLKKRHLRGICTIMIFLKYLSIRGTDVEELPGVIENLNYLEMLDIRDTKVRVLTSRVIRVKKLKHLLAGNKSSESFFTLSLPSGIGTMSNLEVLSHVHVPEGKGDAMKELHSLRLRKLGVLLHGKAEFNAFLSAISEFCGTLQSLSIRIEQPFDCAELTRSNLFKFPLNLLSLSISGIMYGLPSWIKDLPQLEKVTLHDTYLTASGFEVLGKLSGLRKLRIRKNACKEETSKLTFAEEQFRSLKFLLIDCPAITELAFSAGAAPEAQNIRWSFNRLQSISGVDHLTGLKEFVFKGVRSRIPAATRKIIDENTKLHVIDA